MRTKDWSPPDRARYIRQLRRKYESSSNPLYIWVAYNAQRENSRELPEWILQYFDRVSARFSALTDDESPDHPTVVIAEALEMKPHGRSGRGSVFSRYEGWSNDLLSGSFARDVQAKIAGGTKETFAIEEVSAESRTSISTVRRHFKRVKALHPAAFKKSSNF